MNLPVTVTRADLLKFRDYFSGLLGYVQKGIASGRSAAEIVKVASVPGSPTTRATPKARFRRRTKSSRRKDEKHSALCCSLLEHRCRSRVRVRNRDFPAPAATPAESEALIQRARALSAAGTYRESAAVWQTVGAREPVLASLATRESVRAL